MRETRILQDIRAAVAELPGVLVWRNNTGVDVTRGIRFGIGVGGADLVGIATVPALVGEDTGHYDAARIGRFFGLEVKRPGGRARPEQRMWADAVRQHGGFVATVHSVGEALAAIERCRAGDAS